MSQPTLKDLQILCRQWRQWIDNNKVDIDDDYYFKQNLFDIMDVRSSLLQSNIIKREPSSICEYDLDGLIIGYTMIHSKEIEDCITKYIDYWLAQDAT